MGRANVEFLERALQISGRDNERAVKLALDRLLVALKDRQENGSLQSRDFFVSALGALRRIKGAGHAETRLDCLNQCAKYLYSNDLAAEALDASAQIKALSRLTQSRNWMRIAENISGIVKADLGNVPDAVAHYYNAIMMADELGNHHAKVSSLVNLGVALNYGGLYREAIPCFKKAESLAVENPLTQELRINAAGNLAQSYLYLDELAAGYEAINRAMRKDSEPTTTLSALGRAIREFTFVQLALELGRIAEAEVHAVQCARYAAQSRSSRGKFVAKVSGVLCDIYAGNAHRALEVMEAGRPNDDDPHPLRVVALSCLVKAYDKAGMPAKALQHMQDLLAQIRAVREKSISSLMSNSAIGISDSNIQSEENDLRALQFRRATLAAQAAEQELLNAHLETLERLAITAELREESTGQHGYRVARLSMIVAAELNWSKDACYFLERAARLHDIGKIAVPDRILLSSEQLKETQREIVYAHAPMGAELLSKGTSPVLRMAEEIARHHHEWWNGTGYPSRLSGERIPLHARIVALADVFDSLTHGRPYAEAWSRERALTEIENGRGSQFDPNLTDVFVRVTRKLIASHDDLDAFLAAGALASPFALARTKIRRFLAAESSAEAIH